MRLVFFLIASVCLVACDLSNKLESLGDPLIVTEINDTTFFKNVFQITTSGDEAIINDYDNGRLLVVDKDFQLRRVIGKKGNGIGELIDPNFYFIQDSLILVAGNSKGGLNVYDRFTGRFLSETAGLSSEPILSRFVVKDSIIYLSTPGLEHPISAFSVTSRFQGSFGKFFNYRTEAEKISRNDRHLVPLNDSSFMSIGISEPIIQVYSFGGELIHELDYRDIDIVRERLEDIEDERLSDPNANKTTYILASCVQALDNRIYLMVSSNKGSKGTCSEDILVLDMNGSELKHVETLKLHGQRKRWYSTFSIHNSKLIAFDIYSSSIHVYDL